MEFVRSPHPRRHVLARIGRARNVQGRHARIASLPDAVQTSPAGLVGLASGRSTQPDGPPSSETGEETRSDLDSTSEPLGQCPQRGA
ncbi:hypothetical protein PYCCODRAFT_1432063 [Trametes coccinea BRFM310]|uniref:Uncharacterized protein n=1 Tax=Trametes coccinea (strain BRFM310) TaxID=1353009 RepID=A0A1Y2IYP1_TRAC3|nr:hypothetical protein PYCCODRAFT_1432063 [Trametes coccinea BRFM310]